MLIISFIKLSVWNYVPIYLINYLTQVWTTNPSEGVDLLMSEDGIGAMPPTTVIELFKDTCKSYSSTIAICEKIDDQKLYTGYTYQEYWDKSWYAARAMRKVSPYRDLVSPAFNVR